MNENEFECAGKGYRAASYSGGDCGCELNQPCAFAERDMRFCSQLKCTPDKRVDGRNVIFVEVQDERAKG